MKRSAIRNLIVLCSMLPLGLGSVQLDTDPRPSRLYKDARQILALARAQGHREVTLVIAARKGGAGAVAREVARLGGTVRYRDDAVDYLRVDVPLDRVEELAEHAKIESATADFVSNRFRRLRPEMPTAAAGVGVMADVAQPKCAHSPMPLDTTWPPRGSIRPLTHPYRAIRDIDGEGFQKKNPTFDGRGVTIALLDGHLDFLLPEFQTAYTLDGKRVPKLADMINPTDPLTDAEWTPQWVDMRAEAVAQGGRITFGGKTFRAPYDGSFRVGFFDERRFNDPENGAYLDQDVDRNGNPRGDDGKFGILWDEKMNDVWVDTDRDLDFTDEKPMTDYIVRGDWGVFGKDDPKTPVRESIGFTVQTDKKNKFVSVNIGIYQHATGIMGHVVGNEEPNGRIRGVAPGARIVSINYSSMTHSLIEALIIAFRHPLVDIVVLEQHSGIASSPYALADGRHPISIIAQRLIEQTGKLLTVPGSNTPAFALVAEDGLAPGAISAGGYQHRDSYVANMGFEPEAADNMHWGGASHGPSGIGGIKPDLLAPSGQIGTEIGYLWRAEMQEKLGLYSLPPGYSMDGGTSTAAPMMAGAAALVISAAKQTGLKYDAPRLKAALVGSARQIPNLLAYEQGNGLVQVEAAYELLKKLQDWTPVVIESRAPVRTGISHLLSEPHTGVGLFELEGWTVGQRGTRTLTLTRRSGSKEPMTFQLSWQGNDGTFRSVSSVTLPLNRPVEVPVDVVVESPGTHSAILSLTHPSIPGYAHRVLFTVVGSLRPAAENGYSVEAALTLPIPGDRALFVNVPRGAKALRITADREGGGKVSLAVVSPGRRLFSYSCSYPGISAGESCIIPNPEPGVWAINAHISEMLWDYIPRLARPLPPARVTLRATVLGAEVDVPASLKSNVGAGGSHDFRLSVTNQFGETVAALVPEPLASVSRTKRTIARGEQHVYELDVPEGATSVRVGIEAAEGADLDLYLIDCTAEKRTPLPPAPEQERGNKAPEVLPPGCSTRAKDATTRAGGYVEVSDPAPGRWVVVVDAYSAPASGVEYTYRDAYHHPRFGMAAVSDVERARKAGESWTVPAMVWATAEPEANRTLEARFVMKGKGLYKGPDGSPVVLGELEFPLGAPARAAMVSRR